MEATIKMTVIYLCVDKDGTEKLFDSNHGVERMAEYDHSYDGPNIYTPRVKEKTYWGVPCMGGSEDYSAYVKLPKGTIKKLIGKDLTWEDPLYAYGG